jgi:1-acyl-sn-glycerol-3-phosphate acyltransferase
MIDFNAGGAKACYEPLDAAYCRGLMRRVIAPIADHYFRPRLIGAEKIPAKGPVILAANHSGTAFPYDAIVLDFALWRREGMTTESKFRSVYEKELSLVWWMRPFGIDNLWRRGGGVDMTFDNFERLLLRGDRVIYYPEGVPGIGKGFGRRYRLQRFRTSFVRLAARYDVPILPVSIVNAEWVMPFHYTFPPLDLMMRRLFRVPFLPLPAGILAMIFPWMWYLALPAQMTFVVGDPIDARATLREAGVNDAHDPDPNGLDRGAARIRRAMQLQLDANVARFGQRPYHWPSLRSALLTGRGTLARILPTGWAPNFVRFDRDQRRAPARNRVHALLRDLDLAAFYLPFGWPLLSLSRAFRRPPYGYRGLSPDEAREVQGSFVWRLGERPLPPRPEEDTSRLRVGIPAFQAAEAPHPGGR